VYQDYKNTSGTTAGKDSRFRVVNDVKVGLVCFKLNGSNAINRKLLDAINDSGRLHMVPSNMKGEYIIRFALCAENASVKDVDAAWNIIQEVASDLLKAESGTTNKPKILGTVPLLESEETTRCA